MAFTPVDPTKAEVRVTQVGNKFHFDFYFPQGSKGDAGGFVTPTLIAPDIDLNSIVSAGDYRLQSTNATLLLNYPRATMGGMMRVVATGGGSPIIHQQVLPLPQQTVRGIFNRSLVSGIWSGWQFIGSQVVDQTAGRVITTWDDVNNRSQMIYGDTGMRVLADPATAPAWGTISSGNSIYVRRVVNTVHFNIGGFNRGAVDAGTAPYPVVTLPVGFRPTSSGAVISAPFVNRDTVSLAELDVLANGVVQVNRFPTNTGRHYARLSWDTNDAWPTTLPGVASGSIPNL